MKNFFNKAAHFGIGFATGLGAEKPAAPIAAAGFIAYQGIEAYSKGDEGYVEVKEWALGLGLGIACRYGWRYLTRREEDSIRGGSGVDGGRDYWVGSGGKVVRAEKPDNLVARRCNQFLDRDKQCREPAYDSLKCDSHK